ncbi:PREDICTED: uncharacterized protein LOC109587361 [Amphimedon queenslandica]|uniref:TRP C-terminal domain-containing protein n=1 Tax=Amphimedon queenslandica TaxID=400682 RepID=A0A1X7TJZ9_AMPQE|nr:PREDICTED: uncharacterized protein LOC109587361 [Amphimedon queenslandica]XP_019859159.1 PREDICTED: uncharacterized protein LOC109587361 [Amphimedon queenslandica]XP_019859160.1 PREDICTED: uncharacterized protein LOC109587361 [Amphimedon queenslandica]|eukprot:XP_019859158.1 PREDICTED: uncharacterized protein LOC109587361 [Amphimedon queenslandica]
MYRFMLFLLALPLVPAAVFVNTSHQLEGILCNETKILTDNLFLHLDTSITHQITSNGVFCPINMNHYSLTITSDSNDSFAVISCTPSDKYWTRGFAFYSTNGSLTMRGLHFTNCGTNLTTLHSNIINSTTSSIYFTKYHAAVLVLTDIASITVSNVTIMKYSGFAIVAVNLPYAVFDYLEVSYSQQTQFGIGSGLLLLFFNRIARETTNDQTQYQVNLSNSIFHENTIQTHHHRIRNHCAGMMYRRLSNMPVVNAAAVTILFTQNDTAPAIVRILNNSFTFNNEYYAGAMLILSSNSSINSKTIIDGSYFEHNFVQYSCKGGAISASFFFDRRMLTKRYNPLVITNSNFKSNGFGDGTIWTSGAIAVIALKHIDGSEPKGVVAILFHYLKFEHNTSPKSGTCLYAVSNTFPNKSSNYFTIFFDSIVAYSNPNLTVKGLFSNFNPASIFHFDNIIDVFINGSVAKPGNFSHNYGAVFELLRSYAVLEGHLLFNANIANHGAGFLLIEDSVIFLKKGLKAHFTSNTVQSLGGAIYSVNDLNKEAKCTFQLYFNEDDKNISLTFSNNTAALAGNSVYSTNLFDCYNKDSVKLHHGTLVKMYHAIFKNIFPSDIASNAKSMHRCMNKDDLHEIYPGGSIHIPLNVVDLNGSLTYGILTVIPVEKVNFFKKLNWWFSDYQGSFIIKGKKNCTTVNLTIHTTDVTTLNNESLLLLSISQQNTIVEVRVKLKSCPLGFKLSATGSCVCSDLVTKFNRQITCDIENNTFIKPGDLNVWMGNLTKRNNFSIAYCHPSYCNIGSELDLIQLNSMGSYLGSTNSTISLPLCYGSRAGDACGECIPKYSVVFGSTECKDCSSSFWPFTILLYIIAGPLLVLLLYTLNLTLTTGTLNGIIFYAQIANIGIVHYLDIPCNECTDKVMYPIKFVSVFISWLNLNLGFPLCFYNGMTEILKAGLSLLFPVYLLLIVGLLIILSRYSVKISNRFSHSSIQVLVTIVHLSFTKLLQSVLDVFSSAEIFIEGIDVPKIVWYNNGFIEYNSESHRWLMVVTSIVAGLILIPYFIIMLLGNFLLKFDKLREYIRPFYEAIHAPYRRNKWYWFAFYQLFVLLTYVSETSSKGRVPLFLSLLLIYHLLLYLQTKSAPFRYKILNWLNLMILLALNFVFLVSHFMYLTDVSPKQLVMFFAIANYPIIAVFMMIIAYHILLVTNKVNRVLLLYQKVYQLKERFPGFKKKKQYNQRRRPYYGCSDSGDYTEAREPLLEQTLIN